LGTHGGRYWAFSKMATVNSADQESPLPVFPLLSYAWVETGSLKSVESNHAHEASRPQTWNSGNLETGKPGLWDAQDR